MTRIFFFTAVTVTMTALLSMPAESHAGACAHKLVPTEGAQTFTVIVPAGLDTKTFSRELEKQIYALAPSVPVYRITADRFNDFVFTEKSSNDTENQILVYLVKNHFIGSSGVTPGEPFHQATMVLLESLRQAGQILNYEVNSKLDPALAPVDRVIEICVPF